jgi:hypothetical protein
MSQAEVEIIQVPLPKTTVSVSVEPAQDGTAMVVIRYAKPEARPRTPARRIIRGGRSADGGPSTSLQQGS